MTAKVAELSEREHELGAVIVECLQVMEAGQSPRELLARYPQFAAELADFLDGRQRVEQLAGPVRAALQPNGAGAAGKLVESGVLGDFRILREVGRGGMGVVYEAEQISLGRRVALKVLPFAAALDARQLQRFRNEAQAAALLHHQNIVPVHFVGHERGVHFYAMQFIEGQTLAAVISELRLGDGQDAEQPDLSKQADLSATDSGPAAYPNGAQQVETIAAPQSLRPSGERVAATTPRAGLSTERSNRKREFFRTAAGLGIQAAEALEHAHQVGIIHRDIKPANLLVDGGGRLWIADFGLARLQSDSSLTMTGDLLGTLRYMSPEQALAQRVTIDHRTDIYSLGVTLYELLTLEPAYTGRDRQQLLRQIAFEEPRPPRRINPAIPAELETIVLKAAAKNPAERYATAREVADDLRRFLEDQPIRARRPTLVQRARKWARRHQSVVATLVAAGALLLLAVAGFAIAFIRSQERALQDLGAEQSRTKQALDDTRQLTAELALDKGQLLGESGESDDANLALLWMARSLKLAPDPAADLQALARINLGAWAGRVNRLHAILPTEGDVLAVAYTPDARSLLTVSSAPTAAPPTVTIRRWDAATGQPGQTWSYSHQAWLRAADFSPDRRCVLLGYIPPPPHDGDAFARLINLATGQVVWESKGSCTAATFSPDGSKVLLGYRVNHGADKPQTGMPLLPRRPTTLGAWTRITPTVAPITSASRVPMARMPPRPIRTPAALTWRSTKGSSSTAPRRG